MGPPPARIGDYALLGDGQGAALAGRDGSIDWWCAPRFDSRSLFARLLDPAAGHWSIRPAEPFEASRRYRPDTMVLETTFATEGGTVRVVDALALGAGGHELGRDAPHALIRRIEGLAGEVELAVELAPRPEYGLVLPGWVATDDGLETVGGPDTLVLRADVALQVDGGDARTVLPVGTGQVVGFVLHARGGIRGAVPPSLDAAVALGRTTEAWRSWVGLHDDYDGPYADEVRRSSVVLQALTYAPSGAVVAAATTSLPEIVGGDWNWDYRYAWLRDAALTLRALWVAACPDEAERYFDWMARAAAGAAARDHVQIMFGVEGERDLSEHELDHLRGFRDSRPVRVGNAAWSQRQLDVFGEVLDAAWVLRDQIGDELDPLVAAFLRGLADLAAAHWRETDAGIWEGRDGERHYLSSKLMCWVALDRAVALASRLGPGADEARWRAERDAVRADILERGWHEEAGAYTGAYGSDHLDASVLLMPIFGLLPATDERMRATIAAVERELSDGGLVRRWTGATEGSFVICSFWLAQCLALAGEPGRAREIVDRVVASAGDVGLLAEMIDPGTGELIGNYPQAFSHVGLINTAWTIGRVESGRMDEARIGGPGP